MCVFAAQAVTPGLAPMTPTPILFMTTLDSFRDSSREGAGSGLWPLGVSTGGRSEGQDDPAAGASAFEDSVRLGGVRGGHHPRHSQGELSGFDLLTQPV